MMGHFAEWVAGMGPALADHLWQSTACVLAAWLVTLALRANQARVRYAVWLAASIKFLVPFSLLIAAGNLLPHPKQAVAPVVYSAMDVVEEPFAQTFALAAPPVVHVPTLRERVEAEAPAAFFALWVVGAGIVLVRWARGWRVVRRTMREAEVVREGREWEILRRVEGAGAGAKASIDLGERYGRGEAVPLTKANAGVPRLRRFAALLGMTAPTFVMPSERGVELRLSDERMEPGIFGVWRPVLVWPRALSARLEDGHIEAILSHELAHVRRRDNLTAALHMVVETVFWFHPAVWWMERQMVKEREQACDEAVVYAARSCFGAGGMGEHPLAALPKDKYGDSGASLQNDGGLESGGAIPPKQSLNGAPGGIYAEIYAEALLKTCRFCVESPLACVAGVTGADLRQRVVEIVTGRALVRMSWPKKALLAAAAVCVVAAPVVLGQAKAAQRLMRAAIEAAPRPVQMAAHAMIAEEQTLSKGEIAEAQAPAVPAADGTTAQAQMHFDVVSVRPSAPWQPPARGRRVPLLFTDDGVSIRNMALDRLLGVAYELQYLPERIVGGPDWVRTQNWDIEAKVDEADVAVFTRIAHDNTPRGNHLRNLMLQGLLAEQFNMKVHHENREGTIYSLEVAKGGIKARPADPNAAPHMSFRMGGGHLEIYDAQVGTLATFFAQQLGRPVIDNTGSTEKYDMTLDWQPDNGSAAADDPSGKPSLFTALEEQVGVKLVPTKGPVDVIVVDRAEKPSVDGAEVQGQGSVQTMAQYSRYATYTDSFVSPTALVPVGMAQGKTGGDAATTSAGAAAASFEVASIRMVDETQRGVGDAEMSTYPTAHFFLHSAPLDFLIGVAYGIDEAYIQKDAGWMDSQLYDVDARVADDRPLTQEEMRPLLQNLLAQRFHLTIHRTSKVVAGFELVVAKGGPKLKPAKDGAETHAQILPNGLDGQSISIGMLASMLMRPAGETVIDKTGLNGAYDVRLRYAPANDPSSTLPSLFTAVQEQLGLKLEPAKVPVDYLVVDHAERAPTEN